NMEVQPVQGGLRRLGIGECGALGLDFDAAARLLAGDACRPAQAHQMAGAKGGIGRLARHVQRWREQRLEAAIGRGPTLDSVHQLRYPISALDEAPEELEVGHEY